MENQLPESVGGLHFEFQSILQKQAGGMAGHFIIVPHDISRPLLEANIRRTIGTINGAPFNLALLSDGNGGRYLAVGQALKKAAKIVEGSRGHVAIQPDPNPDLIFLCEEMEAVLELDEEAGKIFYGFTKGMQRSLAYYANSAKQSETKIKRALDLAHKMKTGQLYTQKSKRENKGP